MKEFENIKLRNQTIDFKIVNLIKNLKDVVIGYEGTITIDGKEQYMQWTSEGVAYTENRGYDLVIRTKFAKDL